MLRTNFICKFVEYQMRTLNHSFDYNYKFSELLRSKQKVDIFAKSVVDEIYNLALFFMETVVQSAFDAPFDYYNISTYT